MSPTETIPSKLILDGDIITNSSGIKRLLHWYAEAESYQECTVSTTCADLEWFDANLASLWSALMHKLKCEKQLDFYLNEGMLSERFSILIRNGFRGKVNTNSNATRTFIQNASFGPADEKLFTEYIENELMTQRELCSLKKPLQNLLEQNLYELYSNVFRHAATKNPFFICGQYFPSRKQLVVSMVDLGQTFLPPIKQRTNGAIDTQQKAVEWALQGNSELGTLGGGHALKCIKLEFAQSGHFMQIITGDCFYDSSAENSLMGPWRSLPVPMPGTMVNLTFSIKN